MPSLHPDTEKLIAEGPNMRLRWGTYESPQDFARRVALHAVEKEREGLFDELMALAMNAKEEAVKKVGSAKKSTFLIAYVYETAAEHIRRRGKP